MILHLGGRQYRVHYVPGTYARAQTGLRAEYLHPRGGWRPVRNWNTRDRLYEAFKANEAPQLALAV